MVDYAEKGKGTGGCDPSCALMRALRYTSILRKHRVGFERIVLVHLVQDGTEDSSGRQTPTGRPVGLTCVVYVAFFVKGPAPTIVPLHQDATASSGTCPLCSGGTLRALLHPRQVPVSLRCIANATASSEIEDFLRMCLRITPPDVRVHLPCSPPPLSGPFTEESLRTILRLCFNPARTC